MTTLSVQMGHISQKMWKIFFKNYSKQSNILQCT